MTTVGTRPSISVARKRSPRPASTRPVPVSIESSTSARGGAKRFCSITPDIVGPPSAPLETRPRRRAAFLLRASYRAATRNRPAIPPKRE